MLGVILKNLSFYHDFSEIKYEKRPREHFPKSIGQFFIYMLPVIILFRI